MKYKINIFLLIAFLYLVEFNAHSQGSGGYIAESNCSGKFLGLLSSCGTYPVCPSFVGKAYWTFNGNWFGYVEDSDLADPYYPDDQGTLVNVDHFTCTAYFNFKWDVVRNYWWGSDIMGTGNQVMSHSYDCTCCEEGTYNCAN